jgi:hypothetical protein
MRNHRTILFAALAGFVLLIFSGCGSSMHMSSPQPVPADVYVAGTDGTNAALWKNGVETILAPNATADAVAVSGSDVYVAGWVNSPGTPPYGGSTATIWKNGVATALTNSGFSQANGLTLANGNVYAVGSSFVAASNAPLATVWTNGQPSYLSDGNYPNISSAYNTSGAAIAVSGADVYVAGYATQCGIQSPGNNYCGGVAVYWKNGSPVDLGTISPQSFGSFATGIAVSGSAVSVSGVTGANPLQGVVWQNGTQVALNLPVGTGSLTSAVALSGTSVYVAGGDDGSIAGYWANGSFTTFGIQTRTQFPVTSGIALNGSDVYVAGSLVSTQGPQSSAIYWKNGTGVPLPSQSTSARALAIAVVPQQVGS